MNILSKKILTCIFINCIFLSFDIDAQVNTDFSIYGVMSMSTDIKTHAHEATQYDDSDTSFLSLLLRLEKDTFYVVDTLNFDHNLNNTMRSIVQHKQQKFFVFVEKDMYDYYDPSVAESDQLPNSEYFALLDYSNIPFKLRKLKADSITPFAGAAGPALASYNINGEYYWPYTLDKSYFLLSRQMNTSYRLSDFDRMRNYHVENMPGYSSLKSYTYVFHPDHGYILDRNSLSNWREWSQLIDFDYPSEEEDGGKYKSFKILHHTTNSKYTIGKKTGAEAYFIRDNQSLVWDTLSLPCNKFSIYEDNYLFGTLMKYGSSSNFNSIIGGHKKEDLKEYSKLYANKPNTENLTGKIFVFHIPTRKNVFFQGKDIDTELLAFEKGWIYFRDYDSIKKVRFNEKSLSFDSDSIQTIMKNKDLVPNIHHLFFAPKSGIEIEYVIPK
jgi:hypothetical protein